MGTHDEVGILRTVLMHRPGAELTRVTPRTMSRLEVEHLPWLSRAQREHDAVAATLRQRGVDVIYITELLQDVLEYGAARDEAISAVLADCRLGAELGDTVRLHLESLAPEDLASTLIAGLTPAELRAGRGLVFALMDSRDFIIEPLPNLVFMRDSSVWIGTQVVVASLAGPRSREAGLLATIYRHHPRFANVPKPLEIGPQRLCGGDVLLLAPGVLAVGVGARTTAASAERLATLLLDSGIVHTVLAVPTDQRCHAGELGMACTIVDADAVVMVPALAFTLTALTITSGHGTLVVSRPRPFLEAAARAMGVDRLTIVETGLDPPHGVAGQWDDGGNALAVGDRVVICDERNGPTNSRLIAAGFEVITVSAGELSVSRGASTGGVGPRCMCTPVSRDPVRSRDHEDAMPAEPAALGAAAGQRDVAALAGARVPEPAGPVSDQGSRQEELAPLR